MAPTTPHDEPQAPQTKRDRSTHATDPPPKRASPHAPHEASACPRSGDHTATEEEPGNKCKPSSSSATGTHSRGRRIKRHQVSPHCACRSRCRARCRAWQRRHLLMAPRAHMQATLGFAPRSAIASPAPPPADGAATSAYAADLDALARHAWDALDAQHCGVLLPVYVRALLERGAPDAEYHAAGIAVVRELLALIASPPLAAWLRERAAGGLAPPPPERWCRTLRPGEAPAWLWADEWAEGVVAEREYTLYVRLCLVSHAELGRVVRAVDARLTAAGAAAHVPYKAALARPREVLAAAPPLASERLAFAYGGVHGGDVASAREARFHAVAASGLVARDARRGRGRVAG